jgi:hypothetical protein
MPGPIQPAMRKVLDDIAAHKSERDAAGAGDESGLASRGALGQQPSVALDDEARAHWQRQEAHFQVLRQEAAEQTRLLREILARLPARP